MSRRRIIPFLTVILFFSCLKKSEGLKQSDIPALVNQFLAMHVQHHNFNDALSEKTLNNFIMNLDYGKYYFYSSDIKEFDRHKHMVDDYVRQNRYFLVYDIFSRYKSRFAESMKLFNELVELPYDFTKDEYIQVDRDRVPYARTKADMRERWRKSIKLQLLNYMSTGKDLKESRGKLKKKYLLLQKRVNEIDEELLLARFMNSFSTALDPHSNYLTQEEHEDFKISMELKLEGIGVRLRTEDGFVIVDAIIPGGATDKLPEAIKLKPLDRIVAVAQGGGEPVDVIDMDLRDVVKLIRGKKGTEVRLTIYRDTGGKNPARMQVPIIREEIKLQDSDADSDIYFPASGKENPIGYIKLPSFYHGDKKSSAGDIQIHINRLMKKGVKAIVLDLRGNPGGLLNEAVDIAGLFINHGPIVQIKDGMNPPQVIYDNDGGTFYDGPVVVLIDKFSASASEILAGAIKDYNRGLIIGPSNTFGKGTVQSYNELPFEKGAIKITTHIFYQPGGTSNQLYGIKPDITIPDMTSIWDIGESKTRYPLKWNKISSAPFRRSNLVTPRIVSSLQSLSSKRVSSGAEYRKLVKRIRRFSSKLMNKTISLKEESAFEKQKEKELEKNLNQNREEKIMDIKNDLFLREAFRVTGDYLRMISR